MKKSLLVLLLLFVVSCAYFNTFFNAKKRYSEAEKEQKKNKSESLSSAARNGYSDAIKKCWKLIDFYGDSSSYADDALLLIGKSHYHLQEYDKAERVLQQFLANYQKSEFVPEAKLWLSRTYIELKKDDEALKELDNISRYKISKDIAAESFYILADLYFKRNRYDLAIENYQKCIELTSDEEREGQAAFYLGESYMILKEYENAIDSYEKVMKLDVPIRLEFDALIQKSNALLEKGHYEEAGSELQDALGDIRFKDYFSLLETKYALISERQGDIDYAMERYYDILKLYPKTEGAALASFYIGQLFEYEYGEMDSAKIYYDKVKKIYPKSDAVQESSQRSKLLGSYLNIRKKLDKDLSDYNRLLRGDSSLVDSVELATSDSNDSFEPELENQDEKNLEEENTTAALRNSRNSEGAQSDFTSQTAKLSEPPPKKKEAVARDPEKVYESLLKNTYALGEFFLLSYQNQDSAKTVFKRFVSLYEDSLLSPKAFYTLYYIHHSDTTGNPESVAAADSIKKLIIEKYPQSIYAQKFRPQQIVSTSQTSDFRTDSLAAAMYHEAEIMIENEDYYSAIDNFKSIAAIDSQNTWSIKSQYAIAYVYENYLNDIDNAIEQYSAIAKRYPQTQYSKIARNKIKIPPPELPDTTKTVPADSSRSIDEKIDELESKRLIEETDNLKPNKRSESQKSMEPKK